MRSHLKAAVELEAGAFDSATADIEKAFKINPRSPKLHALRASMFYLQDRDFEAGSRSNAGNQSALRRALQYVVSLRNDDSTH